MIKQMKKIGNATLYCADCKDVLPLLKDIDACVTDPPYGLSFMGKKWDYDVPDVDIWTQVHDVLKPGAHLLSFFGSRTYHRGTIPIEDAGFEIRDQIMWLYGSGFPKSYNIAKGIEGKLKHGTANWKDWNKLDGDLVDSKIGYSKMQHKQGYRDKDYSEKKHIQNVKFHTKEAQQYEGWGTALKPAHEPIVMARKQFKGSVAENVLEHGTGGINIDECRVGTDDNLSGGSGRIGGFAGKTQGGELSDYKVSGNEQGRFPANVMHDGSEEVQEIFEDKARYFYCAKANKKDRDEGNEHPTVKPTELMKYLCRLVTPKGGVVLDPFMGSGSTGKAAVMSGFKFVGIEMDEEYFEIACARIKKAQEQRKLF